MDSALPRITKRRLSGIGNLPIREMPLLKPIWGTCARMALELTRIIKRR